MGAVVVKGCRILGESSPQQPCPNVGLGGTEESFGERQNGIDELPVTGVQAAGLERAPKIAELFKELLMAGQIVVFRKFVAQGADSQCRCT